MTEAVRREPGLSGLALVMSARHDPAARILNVDLLTVLIAILLPWSTTGVVIVAVLWIIALVPTLWSDASWGERLYAAGPTAKLLVLPLLLYHFERTARGSWVFLAFLASCLLLMAASWLVAFNPDLSPKLYFSRGPYLVANGIAVKNYIDQSQEFVLCAVALAYPVMALLRANKIWLAVLLPAIAASFLVNMMFVVVSGTALLTMPVMLVLFALLHLRWRTAIASFCAAALLVSGGWNGFPPVQRTASKFFTDY